MFERQLEPRLLRSIQDSRVTTLVGPRQSGKTTLAIGLVESGALAAHYSLDDFTLLTQARNDPRSFLEGMPAGSVIDEVQLAPELIPEIKMVVDRDQTRGRFLLTGSADVLLMPTLSESLAGRTDLHTLLPLSQSEIAGHKSSFLPSTQSPAETAVDKFEQLTRDQLINMLVTGGFPEALQRSDPNSRNTWFDSYIEALIKRDLTELADIEKLGEVPAMLHLLSTRAGGVLNLADIGRAVKLSSATAHRYFSLLENLFIVRRIPAWHRNLGKRLTKAAKLFFVDTGLMLRLADLTTDKLRSDPSGMGAALENFVATELMKLITFSNSQFNLFHYRTVKGSEIDFILETGGGEVIAIEVKATSRVTSHDFRAIRSLSDSLGENLIQGIVLYTGSHSVSFGDRLVALPVQSLWAA